MRHTLGFSGRFLATGLLITIGLSSFGCGDSATVNPEVELSRLSVTPGTLQPGFSGGNTQYRVNLTSDTTTVTVTAQPAVAGDSVAIDGQATTSRTITLDPPGETTVVEIVVSESTTNSRTYTVRLVRADRAGNNSLENLAVSPGTPPLVFNENTLNYSITVGNTVNSVTVTPTLQDPLATMTVNDLATISGQASTITLNPAGQSTTITILVKAQNGTEKPYTITVSRGVSNNNNLRNLTISPGTLNFSAGTTAYTVNLPATLASSVTNVRVTPTLDDATTATMTVNGQAATSGQAQPTPLPQPGSSTFINIVVTAQDRTQQTYTVNVIRTALAGDNNLSGLTVSPGPLDSPFNANDLSYTVNVASTVASIRVTPTLPPNSNASMSLSVNSGRPSNISSGEARDITLGPPDSNTFINIIVTAQNGNRNTYVIAVDKAPSNDNNLSALSVRVGNTPQTLSPRFARNIASYTVDVASNVTRVTVSATKADRFASMAIGSVTVGSGTETGQANISLGGQGSVTPVSITVTPQIGNPKPYSLTITRLSSNTNLSALSVTAGATVLPLSPPFDGSNTVNVATDITTVTVTATLEDTNATMEINGQGTSSGVPSAPITLGEQGSNTNIPIVVIAPNGNRRNYTLTVNRAAPTAPQSPAEAPDLIREDDSCPRDPSTNACIPPIPPSTTPLDEDNITNVATPRFRIPQPGAGQTPSLYSGDDQVPANFNQGDNTLQPTSALSDGEHSISYTLSNAGSESGKSPALTVTIDSAPPGNPGGG